MIRHKPVPLQDVHDDLRVDLIVLNHKHPFSLQVPDIVVLLLRPAHQLPLVLARDIIGKLHGKFRAFSYLGPAVNRSSEEVDQPAADEQAQTCSLPVPRLSSAVLLKRQIHLWQEFPADSDSGILDPVGVLHPSLGEINDIYHE